MSVQIMEKPQANSLTNQALNQLIDARLDELLPKKLAEIQANKTPSMAIIATKGTLDWAYPPFILASTGAALGWDVSIFFTFYGLEVIKKGVDVASQSARQSRHANENADGPELVAPD